MNRHPHHPAYLGRNSDGNVALRTPRTTPDGVARTARGITAQRRTVRPFLQLLTAIAALIGLCQTRATGYAAEQLAAAAPSAADIRKAAAAENNGTTPAEEAEKTERWAQIELRGSYPESPQLPGLFAAIEETMSDAIARIDKAAKDKRISGVVLKFKMPSLRWGKFYEFAAAIRRVQAAGKPVYAWVETATGLDYMLAAQCDRVWMPESSMLLLTGLRAEVTFFKNLLEKIGVQAEMLRIGKYKSAAEPFTRSEMSPEFREQMEALLDDWYAEMVGAIASGRKLTKEQTLAAIDNGPYSAAAAKQAKLLDDLIYEDAVPATIARERHIDRVTIQKKYGKRNLDLDFSGPFGPLKLFSMLLGVQPTQRSSTRPRIAVIFAEGPIMTGRSTSDLFGGTVMGADTIVKAVQKAEADTSVKAIVLRVNSPGGSALASDLIWRSIQQAEKPVVVSMGDVAGSGGYYISMGADAIFATPGTLTGSIGVVSGKLALQGMFEKVGITTSVVSRGKNSGAILGTGPFTPSERAAMERLMHDIYGQFVQKAADGRGMPVDKLEPLAGGRIYSGVAAKTINLVDRLGTLEDAVEHAKKLAGLKPEDAVDRLTLPPATSPLDILFGAQDEAAVRIPPLFGGGSDALLLELAAAAPRWRERLRYAALLPRLARETTLCLMPFCVTVD